MSFLQKLKSNLVWGFILWLTGYIAGILLFFVVPKNLIGWVLSPIASIFTIWVLLKKIKCPALRCYLGVGITWMLMAIVLDYIFLVQVFKTGTSYYQLNVFLYYGLTLFLPITVGYWKSRHKKQSSSVHF